MPWEDGNALARAWPNAELVSTSGLGHRRILDDPEVVKRAVAFVAQGERTVATAPSNGCSHSAWPGQVLCPTCELEQDLRDRSGRWDRNHAHG